MSYPLGTATQAYQAQLETLRRFDTNESLYYEPFHSAVRSELEADLEKARNAMEIAWCECLLAEAGC